jgi:hypothetical protein
MPVSAVAKAGVTMVSQAGRDLQRIPLGLT